MQNYTCRHRNTSQDNHTNLNPASILFRDHHEKVAGMVSTVSSPEAVSSYVPHTGCICLVGSSHTILHDTTQATAKHKTAHPTIWLRIAKHFLLFQTSWKAVGKKQGRQGGGHRMQQNTLCKVQYNRINSAQQLGTASILTC